MMVIIMVMMVIIMAMMVIIMVIIGRNGDDGDHRAKMENCTSCPRLIQPLQLLFLRRIWNGMKILQVLTHIPLLPNEYHTNTIASKEKHAKG